MVLVKWRDRRAAIVCTAAEPGAVDRPPQGVLPSEFARLEPELRTPLDEVRVHSGWLRLGGGRLGGAIRLLAAACVDPVTHGQCCNVDEENGLRLQSGATGRPLNFMVALGADR